MNETLTTAHLDAVRAILAQDPVWAAYALADLQPAYLPDCRWLLAPDHGPALALVYSGLQPPILLTVGEAAALERALSGADLPPAIYVSIREEHLPVVARRYDLSGDLRPMLRMRLADPAACLAAHSGVALQRLRGDDAERVLRLLQHGGPFTPDYFSPVQMEAGVFFGVSDAAGELCAVGGTHIVDPGSGIGAVGNMYTRPDSRRRGYAAAVLAAIVRELHNGGMHTIVLNVDQRNPGARALYEAHGFVLHTPYLEGKGRRVNA